MSNLKMWRSYGVETQETSTAIIVYIPDGEAMKEFIALAEGSDDEMLNGIAEEEWGLYLWDYDAARYTRIKSGVWDGLFAALRYVFSEEEENNA